MIKPFVAKAQLSHSYFNQQILDIINETSDLQSYKIECEKEVKLMKENIIPKTTISFYNLLTTSDLNQLAAYATNSNVLKAFKFQYKISSEPRKMFHVYYDDLRYQIKKGLWHKLLLSKVFGFFSAVAEAEGNEGLPKLPALCVAEIFSYLSNRDLQILHHVCNVKLDIFISDVTLNYDY